MTKVVQKIGGVEFDLPPGGLGGGRESGDTLELDKARGDAEDSNLSPNQLEGGNTADGASMDGGGGNNTVDTDSNGQHASSTLEGTPNAVEETLL